MMSKQGLKSLFPMEDIAVMGIWELFPHLKKIRVSNTVHNIFSLIAYLSHTKGDKKFNQKL